MLNWLQKQRNRNHNKQTLATFARERELIRKSTLPPEVVEVEVAAAQENTAVEEVSGYRVDLFGAEHVYHSITLKNYQRTADRIGHLETENEFLLYMCVIDKCEEFGDYERMVSTFKVFEYVVTHKKVNNTTFTYARRFVINMRKYLTELGLL